MQNPLEQFFSVEERPDGVYIKVSRIERDSIRIPNVIAALEDTALVINLNNERIKDVILDASGEFELIGPPFEYYDAELEQFLHLNIKPASASIKISSGILKTGKKPTPKFIQHYLAKNGIVHGVKPEWVKDLIENKIYDSQVKIAEATPAISGEDAQIIIKVLLDPEIHPKVLENGSVDYRNIQTFTSVEEGEELAEKLPITDGKPGTSVTGEPIPFLKGKDNKLPCGRNTQISEDGRFLTATKTGVVCKEGFLLRVVELLQIPGDVDYGVGNIKYSGDVLINGNVIHGFTVEAEGNIHIKGVVESARVISREGHITVEKGIIGKCDTLISAKGGVQILFAQEARIVTEGTLVVSKYLLHCDCACGEVEAISHKCNIIGGETKAENRIIARNVGSEQGIFTRITLFDKQKAELEDKLKELNELAAKLQKQLQPVEKQLKSKADMLKRSSEEVSGLVREEVKKLVNAYNSTTQKINYIQKKTDEIKEELSKPKDYVGYVEVQGTAYPDTEINLYGSSERIANKSTNKRFKLDEDGMITNE